MNTFVSVIIATRNRDALLAQTLHALNRCCHRVVLPCVQIVLWVAVTSIISRLSPERQLMELKTQRDQHKA